ncbi:MAG: ATP-binding protein [Chloroflexota bacterium]
MIDASGDGSSLSAEDLFEDAPCGYLVLGPDGDILRANRTMLAWTGYERGDLAERRFQDLLSVPSRMFYATHVLPLLRIQGFVKEIAFDLARSAREPLPTLVNAVERRDTEQRLNTTLVTILDASDRRRYERELLAARRHAEGLAAVVRGSSDAIIVVSRDYMVQVWNASAERLLGYSRDEAVNRPLGELCLPADHLQEFGQLDEQLHRGGALQIETWLIRKDGARVDVSLSLTPQLDELRQLVSVSLIARDVSERKLLEAAREELFHREHAAREVSERALRMRDEFLALAAHELRTPIAVLRGQSQLHLRRVRRGNPLDSDSAIDAFTQFEAQSRKLQRLVDQLLDLAHIDMGTLTLEQASMDLAALVRQIVADARHRAPEHPIHLTGPAVLMAVIDPLRIEQLINNLLNNAFKFAPAGELLEVTLETEIVDDAEGLGSGPDAQGPANFVGSFARLSVRDHGPGIPIDARERIFDRYQQVRESDSAHGFGLGLFLCRQIAELHGGSINIESPENGGARFVIRLPLSAAPAVPDVRPAVANF